jgi:hypothetical protein
MADWIETDDPAIVASPAGQEVPRALVPPSDRIVPRAAQAPVAAPMGAPAPAPMAGAPQSPLTAQSVLAKLDEPSIAAARGQLPIAQQTTTTQSAVPMSTLKPVMDRGTARADKQAESVTQLGEQKAQIGEQQAMTASTAAFGQMQTSQAEADQASQRADIARQNQIAISAQEDPEIKPDRFIQNMSTGQSIGTVILAAIEGAFRGMVGQAGKSGVADILERRIDQDIAAQKEQIASGRIRRGNMISYFREQGMNEEASEKAAKAMAYAQAEKLTQAEIARQGAGMARPEAAALAEQLKAAREQANDELVLSLGTPRSTTSTVRAPAASTQMTDAQRATEMKAGRDIEQMKASGLTQEEFNKQQTEFSSKAALNDDLVQRAQQVVEALGGRVTPEKDAQGNIVGYKVDGDLDRPHLGKDGTLYESAVSNLKRADVMAMAREPSAKLQDEFAESVDMPFRDSQKKVKLQNILNMALRERQNLAAGYNPAVTGAVQGKKASVGIPYPEAK